MENVDFEKLRAGALPHSLARVIAPSGCAVWVLGTNHLSHRSMRQVRNLIQAVKPQIVAVELSADRAAKILQSNLPGAEEKYTVALQRPISSLLSIAHRVNAQRLNTKPGAEFHAALEEAHQCGSDVLFADRPSFITGRRIWRTISVSEVGRVIRAFASSIYAQTQEQKRRGQNVLVAIDQVMQDDGISHARNSLIPRLREASPTIARVWVDERDEFMVSGIKQVVDSEGDRVKNLVAIVGEAHVAGIASRLAQWQTLRDPDVTQDELLSIPDSTFTSSIALPSLLIGAPLVLVSVPIFGTWRFAHWAGPKLSKLVRG